MVQKIFRNEIDDLYTGEHGCIFIRVQVRLLFYIFVRLSMYYVIDYSVNRTMPRACASIKRSLCRCYDHIGAEIESKMQRACGPAGCPNQT